MIHKFILPLLIGAVAMTACAKVQEEDQLLRYCVAVDKKSKKPDKLVQRGQKLYYLAYSSDSTYPDEIRLADSIKISDVCEEIRGRTLLRPSDRIITVHPAPPPAVPKKSMAATR